MATKFAEVTLSMCYRQVDANGKIYGGPFQYIEGGMRDIHYPRSGKILAVIFAIFCLGGALGGGNMFQSNQAVKMMVNTFAPLHDYGWALSLLFAGLVFTALVGSIKRIAKIADVMVPLKGMLYLACAVIVVGCNITQLPAALMLIFHSAFTAGAAKGGFIGMLAIAF